ncbi:MAG: IS66 family transposase [Terriglobia bacterium]
MLAKPTIIELEMDRLEDVLRRAEAALKEEDYALLKAVVESYAYVAELVGNKNTTIARLRKMLFGAGTEKTAAVLGKAAERPGTAVPTTDTPPASGDRTSATVSTAGPTGGPADEDSAAPAKNHGRNGADAYTAAEVIEVRHESLQPGDPCPQCVDGTLYDMGRPGVIVRLVGQPPIGATVYYLQKLRCGLCGALFTAAQPDGVGEKKYDATVGSMIALLKYGSGVPFHRAERLQASLGIPLPSSTQWDIVRGLAEHLEPIFAELVGQAAQGDVLYHDDTTVKILALMGDHGQRAASAEVAAESAANSASVAVAEPAETAPANAADVPAQGAAKKAASERRGLFTSGVVSTREGRRIALFFSGRQHAGENLKDVLAERAAELEAPIQMCDALSRNMPAELRTIVANCLAHARRQFVEVVDRFPEECRHVLEALAVVYRNDALARQRNLSPQARLEFHQAQSGPTMEELRVWLVQQFDQRRVEPNSALGGAISYLLKHWEKLTLFLHRAGAPLDNNVCEQALKKAILHRKNALFYKTPRGAHVGDVFMSLIYTCELGGVNPFDYLTALERHAGELSAQAKAWMPWNYHELLEERGDAEAPSEEDRLQGRCCRTTAQGVVETHETRIA